MALGLNKILIAGANSNTAGAYFTTQTLIAPATVAGNVVPAGVYLMFPTLNSQIYANNGTALALLIAANTGGVLVSDGVNVVANSTTTANTITFLTVNGGQNVSSTFTS
jgi:hypothetical protein